MSNWFKFTPDRIHEDDKTPANTLETLDRFKTVILKIFAMLWLTILICAFSAIVVARVAFTLPLF